MSIQIQLFLVLILSPHSLIRNYDSMKNRLINVAIEEGDVDRIITQNPGQGVSSEFR